MHKPPDINEYIKSLIASPRMGDQVAWHTLTKASPSRCAEPEKPWPDAIRKILAGAGIETLYRHQAEAIDRIRSGRHVMVATPTASGKTMVYNLPVLENVLKNPASKALYLFPLKALAQDQLRTFQEMAARSPELSATAAIYDGDTSDWHRKKIRRNPPSALLTNPEMLHLSLLPHHRSWAALFADLEMVIVDEVHTYRGVMGSHMAQVFRRFLRICRYYGASPTFVFSSATVGNPGELARDLTGLGIETITQSGAPAGRKHIVFMESVRGPAQTAILLLKAALHRGLRTIVYTQSRKMTELIALWAGSRSGAFADKISPYRAGLLPEERREIEARLANGDLLAVISTSALELGIDIGDLDLCLLVGYPGTIVATWQRAGRVGRGGQDSAVILMAGEDALDQYFIRNPEDLITREPEAAVVNPYNPEILRRHLVCAAAELPLKADEPLLGKTPVLKAVAALENEGKLLRSGDGREIYSRRKAPHRDVDLRGSGSRFDIICAQTGKHKGEIDGFRAVRETHPGAVYLHNGKTYLVETLAPDTRTVKIAPAHVDYYTRVRGNKDTEILEVTGERTAWGTHVFCGRLRVTDQVTGYEKWRIHGRKRISIVPLDLPPQTFETEGLWFRIPPDIQRKAEAEYRHFMGGIHAVEHAAIGIFPLLVMTDRNDLGGISTPVHPQVGSAAVFVYDGVPGGAGLSRQAFGKAEELLAATLSVIAECPCEFGCPSCVHSPKCGSGNRPIDKAAAGFILEQIRKRTPEKLASVRPRILSPSEAAAKDRPNARPECEVFDCPGETKPSGSGPNTGAVPFGGNEAVRTTSPRVREKTGAYLPASPALPKGVTPEPGRFGVLDIETRRSAQEVGGWHRADRMGISCVVLYDSAEDRFLEYLQDQVDVLVGHLQQFDRVIGFNIKGFDYKVLTGHSDFNFKTLPTLDILEEVRKRLGYRLSLDHLARVTLGAKKSADGLQALKWWKEGRIRDIIDYCRIDVEVTRDLFLYGRENGYLLFRNKAGNTVRVPVAW
ncbi:DEAD/DEAH box helicase [Desulfonema ishimotonii]|uniref:DEAD/DEAH box helicase n=1 Tax=Desulfonema ishimotonii TaxID=45657 RepID=A0A401FVN7_9BACT|nr:DEAD/DEAH box helicase [Desulfonema ishimotonii]GBC61013.1 DEAD/DEAH box helicase [Desulfonema ishimotonii]